MSENIQTVLGVIAAITGSSASMPQIWKAYKTGSTGDLHWLSMTLRGVSSTCWIAYSVEKSDWILCGSSCSVILLESILLLMKFCGTTK